MAGQNDRGGKKVTAQEALWPVIVRLPAVILGPDVSIE